MCRWYIKHNTWTVRLDGILNQQRQYFRFIILHIESCFELHVHSVCYAFVEAISTKVTNARVSIQHVSL